MVKDLNGGIFDLGVRSIDISKLPITIRNKVLMAPGTWNDATYSEDEIKKAFDNMDWNDKDSIGIIADHASTQEGENANSGLSVHDWFGFIRNPRLDSTGEISNVPGAIIGDLEIHDSQIAQKLVNAEAKFGISPRVYGDELVPGIVTDFSFKHFAVVTSPAISKAYINLSKKEALPTEKVESQLPEKGKTRLKGGLKNMQEKQESEEKESKEESSDEEKKTEDLSSKMDKLTEQVGKLTEVIGKSITKDMESEEAPAEEVKEEEKAEEPKEEVKEEAKEAEEEVAEKPAEDTEVKDMAKKLEETTAKLKDLEKQMNAPEKAPIQKDLAVNPMCNSYTKGDQQMAGFLRDNYS